MLLREQWLRDLSPSVRKAVQERLTPLEFAAGRTIRRAGDRATGMYEVEQGHVKLMGLNSDGRKVLITLYGPGNCFGEAPLVSRRPFNHTMLALTDLRVQFLSERDFWQLYEQFREVPDALCRKLAGSSSRLFAAREWRSTLRLRDLVIGCFTNLAQDCGVARPDGTVVIDLPLVQNDFAEFLEVTRQAVQREIGALKAMGLVSQLRGQWVIHDLNRLR